MSETITYRFENKYIPEPNTGCWIWLACTDIKGYGRIAYLQKNMRAPRVSWLLNKGDVPGGLHILHKCDNKLCVNPDHLFLGTNRDNSLDAAKKGLIWHAKLTATDIPNIRRMRASGKTFQSIAQHYGVDRKTIEGIFNGKSWQHA